jgi:hypothetical protein
LISIYEDFRKKVGTQKMMNLTKMWVAVAAQVTANGFEVSGPQCKSKWTSLERAYKLFIDNNTKTGRGRRDFKFER